MTKSSGKPKGTLRRIFWNCELLLSTDTYQFSDYSVYLSTCFDAEVKKKRCEEFFSNDLRHAFELGEKLAAAAKDAKD
jgi:hypothetical protein